MIMKAISYHVKIITYSWKELVVLQQSVMRDYINEKIMKYLVCSILTLLSGVALASSPKQADISKVEISGILPGSNLVFSIVAHRDENGELKSMKITRGSENFEAPEPLLAQVANISLDSLVVTYEDNPKEARTYLYVQFCYGSEVKLNNQKTEINGQYDITITPDNRLLYVARSYCRL
jgi:hypothetical protein